MIRKNISSIIIISRLSGRSKQHAFKVCRSTCTSSPSLCGKELEYKDVICIKKETEEVHLKTKTKRKSILDDKERFNIPNYVHDIDPVLIDVCVQKLKFHKLSGDALYFMDKNTAAEYVSLIKNDLLKNTCFVIEMNPGYGVLTKELLKVDIPSIHLYESRMEFHPILKAICDMYPGKLDLRNFNLLTIYNTFDKLKNEDRRQIFLGVENKKYQDETCMQIIGAISAGDFFLSIIQSLLCGTYLMSYGRSVFYLAIPPSLWQKYTCDIDNWNLYTCTKVIFQTMFDCKLLGTLTRKTFLPLPRQSRKNKHNRTRIWAKQDYDQMNVVKIEPKIHLFSQLSRQDWITFSYFVKHHMQKRRSRVIPELEKWIPGCGIRLIAKDYTIFTQFGDLTPAQMLQLFKEFKSWPEYNESNFSASINNLNVHNELATVQLEDNPKLEE